MLCQAMEEIKKMLHLTLCWLLCDVSHCMTKPTNWTVRPAKTQISLGIRPVWSESSLCAQWVAMDPSFLHADSEHSDQTGWMPRLIWVFAGHTCHFVGFVMRRFMFVKKTYMCVSAISRLLYTDYFGVFQVLSVWCFASLQSVYCNNPKFSDRQAWANGEDPDQRAPRGEVWSGFALFAILYAFIGLITLW